VARHSGGGESTIVTYGNTAIAVTPEDDVAQLVVIFGADLGKRIEIGPKAVEIGRAATCDIPIDQESVSRRHARVFRKGTAYRVEDLGSTNGTFVNDGRVAERDLVQGDQVKIGRTIFKFLTGRNVEASYHEEIYRLMTFDGLTQIYNKRYFHEALERETSRARRYDRGLSLVMFDVDHFKEKNDTFGHVAGDRILRELAGVVRNNLRREDVVARVGGEEFAVLTPEVGMAGAREAAEKVRRVVEATAFAFEGRSIPTTVSLGVSTWLGKYDQPEEFYARADAALYAAKQSGRNRIG
jgi:two-component system, cell cycle response regulator